MNPTQFAARLRRIAIAIDNSERPQKELVLRELRQVTAAITRTAGSEVFAKMSVERDGEELEVALRGTFCPAESPERDHGGGWVYPGCSSTVEDIEAMLDGNPFELTDEEEKQARDVLAEAAADAGPDEY